MKDFKVKIDLEFSVTAENKDEVLANLEEQLARENTTAENQFWDNAEVFEDRIEEAIEWIENQKDLEMIPNDYGVYEVETPNGIMKFDEKGLIEWVDEEEQKIKLATGEKENA